MVADYLFYFTMLFHNNSTPLWLHGKLASMEASIDYMALRILRILTFRLVPHLLRLVTMVAKFLCVKEK